MAFRVKDAATCKRALERCRRRGSQARADGAEHPAIRGIGSLLYLVDRYGDNGSIYDVDFQFFPAWSAIPRAWA
jgi:4-hydroxyphenylpyruvate dioxygenase